MHTRLRVRPVLLALAILLAPRCALAQVFYRMVPPGPGELFTMAGSTSLSQLNGNAPAPGTIGEVAISEAILRPGDQVPLPTYADGSHATENEIFWTTHLWVAHFPEFPCEDTTPRYKPGDFCAGGFTGRTWGGGGAALNNDGSAGGNGQCTARSNNVEVVVTVIAVRALNPTRAPSSSWGHLKSIYR
jgi:hypothetical protein